VAPKNFIHKIRKEDSDDFELKIVEKSEMYLYKLKHTGISVGFFTTADGAIVHLTDCYGASVHDVKIIQYPWEMQAFFTSIYGW